MIYFIGAGPGAVDLITVKGKELLEKASFLILRIRFYLKSDFREMPPA